MNKKENQKSHLDKDTVKDEEFTSQNKPAQYKVSVSGTSKDKFCGKKLEFKNLPQDIVLGLEQSGITAPTPIQESSFYPIMNNLDILAQSMTGSGKTLAFALPIALKVKESKDRPTKNPTVLILTPTRELADQITKVYKTTLRSTGCKIVTLIGGVSYTKQEQGLKSSVDIVVGTPGRIADMIRKKKLQLNDLRSFVLDEVDQMLDIGFAKELNFIRDHLPKSSQTLFFSATMNKEARNMASSLLKDPFIISVESSQNSPKNIEHGYLKVKSDSKLDALVSLLVYYNPNQAIIFCETKKECSDISSSLSQKLFSCAQLNSDINQYDRQLTMNKFKSGKLQFLVATNVAARGIDVQDLPLVINYTPPTDKESYTHRVGRTGRAGAKGKAWTMVTPSDFHRFQRLLKILNVQALKITLPNSDSFLEKIVSRELNKYSFDKLPNGLTSDEILVIEKSLMHLTSDQIKSIVTQNLASEINKFRISDPSQFHFSDIPFQMKRNSSRNGRSSSNRIQPNRGRRGFFTSSRSSSGYGKPSNQRSKTSTHRKKSR